MNGNNSYQERQSTVNYGEILFERYCVEKNYKYWHLGNDEKNGKIDHYYRLNPMIRNLPDYIVDTNNGTFVVNVKGTANFKKKELDLLPLFLEWFNSKEAPLVYAFCFANQKPLMVYPEKIIELYKQAGAEKQWSDGVIYKTLKL